MFRFKQNVSFVLKPLMSHTLVLKTPARGVSSVYRYKSRYLYRKLDIHRMVNMKAHELLKQLYDFYIRMGGANTNFYVVLPINADRAPCSAQSVIGVATRNSVGLTSDRDINTSGKHCRNSFPRLM